MRNFAFYTFDRAKLGKRWAKFMSQNTPGECFEFPIHCSVSKPDRI